MEQIDKAKLLKWIDENWEMERTSGSINGEARAIVWHEINDKIRSGELDPDPASR
jgi:hypothetical protein